MTDHLLLYSGGSMPETEEEQKIVMDARYSTSARTRSTQPSTWRRAARCSRAVYETFAVM
jgi:hypothetical protein